MFELLSLLEAKPFHDLGHAISRAEIPHQVVFKAHVETRSARITLARATSTELSIDSARLMAFGANHEQTAFIRNPLAQLDVRAAAGHVGRNRHRAGLASALEDFRLLHVELRIEHV